MQAFYAEEGLAYEAGRAEQALGLLLADPTLGRAWLVEGGVGYVVVTAGFSLEFAGRFALLDEIYLVPEARGRGLGGRMLAFVAEACRAKGFQALRLEVERHNAHARGLYSRSGFVAHDRDLMTRML